MDEAHNLVDRASSMYSAEIVKEDFLELKKLTAQYGGRMARHIGSCNRELLTMKKEIPEEGYRVLSSIAPLHLKLLSLHEAIQLFLEEHRQIPERKEVLNFYFNLTSFLNIAEMMDENYVVYDEIRDDGRFVVRLYCVKPAVNIRNCLDKGLATVFFSATILPVRYYMEMLSDCPEDRAIYIPSPFSAENRKIMIANDVTTRYTNRNEAMYRNIYSYIERVISARLGNYMVFFPSYAMLEKVHVLTEELPESLGVEVIAQEQYMTESDRESFLRAFEEKDNVLALCIMGGIFSEGIDLTGDRLIGAIIVGPGLPQVCTERKLMMDYFDSRTAADEKEAASDRNGFRYAYQYPGINKVFQAAGRVIRTETDQGIILLIDERFATRRYTELFPVEWNDSVICNMQNVDGILEQFWDYKSKEI
ncbi:ATP-dependent DNA helicase [Coprococcus sp. OM06-25]|uniref:ATP-dependent DNA helicase n=1 Tax=Coprococcus sp. OM06-25 TaxID=2293094 RepID=UPI002E8E3A2D